VHNLISDNAKLWRHRLFSMCLGISFSVAILLAGCSSGSNSTAIEAGTAPADSLAASPQVYEILTNSCFDCHSDRGSGSWSAKFAPSYLFGAHKARKVLNFANWATLDVKQRMAMASAITVVVDSGSMPPGDYDFFHPSAKLSDEQKRLVLQWTTEQIALSAHMRRVSRTTMDAALCSANPSESRQFRPSRRF
jgi:heme-binding protein